MVNAWDVTRALIAAFVVVYLVIATIFYSSQALMIINEKLGNAKCGFGPVICSVLMTLGFPEPFLNPQYIIPYTIVPFITLVAIVYLFIPDTLKASSRIASLAIPIGAGLMMVYSGVFAAAVAVTLVMLGNYAFTLFIAIFILSSMSTFMKLYRKAKKGITGAEEEIISAERAYSKLQEIKRKWNEMCQSLPIDPLIKDKYFKKIEETEKLFNEGKLHRAIKQTLDLERAILGKTIRRR